MEVVGGIVFQDVAAACQPGCGSRTSLPLMVCGVSRLTVSRTND
jgi:hypothetical protein